VIRDGWQVNSDATCKRPLKYTKKIIAESHLTCCCWSRLMPSRVVWRNLVEEVRSGWRCSVS
jgi:hypothetical protein